MKRGIAAGLAAVAIGLGVFGAAVAHERIDNVTIRIVSPSDGAVIEGSSVRRGQSLARIRGWQRARHVAGQQPHPDVTDLEPGTQEIMVVPSNARHQELDTAGRLLIEIADSPAAAAPPSTDGTPLVVAGVAFVVSRRK